MDKCFFCFSVVFLLFGFVWFFVVFFLTVFPSGPFHGQGWVGDREVTFLTFKTLCYVMNPLLIVNMHREVGVFVPLASLEEQICF